MEIGKKAFILFIISLLFMIGMIVHGYEQQDIHMLIQAFEYSGADLNAYSLHVAIPYGKYKNNQQLLSEGKELSQRFHLPQSKKLVEIGLEKGYLSKGSWGKASEAELQWKRISKQHQELYLVFKLNGTDSLEQFQKDYQQLLEILQKNQMSPIINSCIQGNINDKLSNIQQVVLIEKIIHILGGEKVETLNTALVKSISAYSPKIQHSIWTGHKKMNVQVATHVNKLTQTTILTMGTPIITIEY